MHPLRLAARSLRRAPAFALAVIASLGLCIAAVTTVFSLADAVLFRALPFRDPGALVWLGSVRPTGRDAPFSLPEFMDYGARARTVEIAGYTSWSGAMGTSTVARRLHGMRISANGFDLLGVSASAGRLFRPEDDRASAPRVVLLSHAFWQEQFGGSPGAVGQIMQVNNQPHEIIGVMPRHFPLPLRQVDIVLPLVPDLDPRRHERASVNFLRLFGRLEGGATAEVTAAELTGIAGALRTEHPAAYASKLGVAATPMQEYLVGGTRTTFVVLLGAAGLLLGLGLANVLNLLLVRGLATRGEMAVRQALGGSAWHLVAGGTGEALLLAGAGAALGGLLAWWLVGLAAASGINIPRLDEARVAGRTLTFIIAIATVATGLFSAIRLHSVVRALPQHLLSGMGRGLHGSRRDARLRATLLVVQLGLAMLLTVVTATMGQSLLRLQAVDLGFRPDSVLLARLSLPPQKFTRVADLARFAERLEQELRTAPGVAAAGAISIAPYSGNLSIIPFGIEGRPVEEGERLEAHYRLITPGYLSAIGAVLRSGRGFGLEDHQDSPPVALISDALARRHFGETAPLGHRLLIDDNNTGPRPVTVVGVVQSIRHVSPDGPAPLDIYLPMAQAHPDGLSFVIGSHFWAVRPGAGPEDPSRTLRTVVGRMDPDIALARIQPMGSYVDASLASRRFSVVALLGFAFVALILATIGVYGVVAYSVAQRRREIGLRLALGATGRNVAGTVVMPAFRLTLLGIAIGAAGAVFTRRLVAGLLFGVTPTQPLVLAAVGAVLLLAGGAAAAIPARAAIRVDPAAALLER
jgi:predicted permease